MSKPMLREIMAHRAGRAVSLTPGNGKTHLVPREDYLFFHPEVDLATAALPLGGVALLDIQHISSADYLRAEPAPAVD